MNTQPLVVFLKAHFSMGELQRFVRQFNDEIATAVSWNSNKNLDEVVSEVVAALRRHGLLRAPSFYELLRTKRKELRDKIDALEGTLIKVKEMGERSAFQSNEEIRRRLFGGPPEAGMRRGIAVVFESKNMLHYDSVSKFANLLYAEAGAPSLAITLGGHRYFLYITKNDSETARKGSLALKACRQHWINNAKLDTEEKLYNEERVIVTRVSEDQEDDNCFSVSFSKKLFDPKRLLDLCRYGNVICTEDVYTLFSKLSVEENSEIDAWLSEPIEQHFRNAREQEVKRKLRVLLVAPLNGELESRRIFYRVYSIHALIIARTGSSGVSSTTTITGIERALEKMKDIGVSRDTNLLYARPLVGSEGIVIRTKTTDMETHYNMMQRILGKTKIETSRTYFIHRRYEIVKKPQGSCVLALFNIRYDSIPECQQAPPLITLLEVERRKKISREHSLLLAGGGDELLDFGSLFGEYEAFAVFRTSDLRTLSNNIALYMKEDVDYKLAQIRVENYKILPLLSDNVVASKPTVPME